MPRSCRPTHELLHHYRRFGVRLSSRAYRACPPNGPTRCPPARVNRPVAGDGRSAIPPCGRYPVLPGHVITCFPVPARDTTGEQLRFSAAVWSEAPSQPWKLLLRNADADNASSYFASGQHREPGCRLRHGDEPARLDDGFWIAGLGQAAVQFGTPVGMDVVVGADGLVECVGESALGDDG